MGLFLLEEGSFHSREYRLRIRDPGKGPTCVCVEIGFGSMPTEFPDDETVDELLRLAGVSSDRSGARRWLESALVAAGGKPDPRRVPQLHPAKHNAPLDEIERASNRLIAALKKLRSHPHAEKASGGSSIRTRLRNEFEIASVIPTLAMIRDAARNARIGRLVGHETSEIPPTAPSRSARPLEGTSYPVHLCAEGEPSLSLRRNRESSTPSERGKRGYARCGAAILACEASD